LELDEKITDVKGLRVKGRGYDAEALFVAVMQLDIVLVEWVHTWYL